jgi:large subunit ribosomal protein L18|tara:strand:+ start:122 stop:484 length:363 start_codon:yes stop_codon:yes gene_type:complete
MLKSNQLRLRRKKRVRSNLRGARGTRPRLSVFRSNKNIYAQIIDDLKGCTIVSASSQEKEVAKPLESGSSKDAAVAVGKLVAERAAVKGLNQVIFDRGSYLFHGRVKALADAAREAGLKF